MRRVSRFHLAMAWTNWTCVRRKLEATLGLLEHTLWYHMIRKQRNREKLPQFYLPLKTGSRFSAKAFIASAWSSDWDASAVAFASQLSCAAKDESSPA